MHPEVCFWGFADGQSPPPPQFKSQSLPLVMFISPAELKKKEKKKKYHTVILADLLGI